MHQISENGITERKADVVFVHGLGGDAFDTWMRGKNRENFWPNWIAQEFSTVRVWSLGYAASSTKWQRVSGFINKNKRDSGHAMSLPDRARQVLDLLVQNGLGERPIMFICHSLGGLLVKQILRMSSDSVETSAERGVYENTRAVLFLATPHEGADLATLVASFRIAFPTLAIEDLKAHNAHLRDLFEWYRNHLPEGAQTRTYYESRRVASTVLIVNPSSANPGVGDSPVPLDEDHISIAKPLDRNAQVYVAASSLLREHVLKPVSDWRYHKDIKALSRQSKERERDLSELSRLRIGQSEIKITRPCVQQLRKQVEEQSVVVVGEPGAGKSGALNELVATLLEEGRDTVYLAVDRLDAESQIQLMEQLSLKHELAEVLENWTGNQPAFLVIDALDAARSDRTAQMLLHLLTRIFRTQGRWRVVASIRKFDLRHNPDLRRTFSGQPPLEEYKDPELARVCHVQIPVFSEEELLEVSARSTELQTLIDAADGTLKQLLRVPFNLRVMAELLGEGVLLEELTPIRTQLELFDCYWEERVIQPRDGQRDAREDVLRRAVIQMVDTRTLRVARAKVVTPETSLALDQILSEHVLIEWQPTPTLRPDDSNLTFAHHVLFDYGVARLLLRSEMDLTQRLASDPKLALVIRPSLVMHFQHIWSIEKSRSIFWNQVLAILEDKNIPEVGKLIGPVIAAESSTKLSELLPILQGIEDPSRQTSAEAALRHVIGGLQTMAPADKSRRMAGQAAGPWSEFVEYLSQKISHFGPYIVRLLLTQLCEQSMALTVEQQKQVGVAARNLLYFVWAQDPMDGWLVKHAITCVCQTYGSNSDASSNLLRLALRSEHLADHGYQEIPWLAYEIRNIMNYDHTFVRDLYITAFGYVEKSEEVTSYGGRIFSLNSNRRQDYYAGLYQFGEDFEYFIELAPVEAIEALISIIDHYVLTKHIRHPENDEETFLFNGVNAIILTDYSSIWDTEGHYDHDQPFKMMDTFQTYFTDLSSDPSKTELCQQLVHLLVTRNRMAALWRRILICGAVAPANLGLELRSLGWSLPILKSYDTNRVVGDFLRAVYNYLTLEDREKVERAILSIPLTFDTSHTERGERLRDSLLDCLPQHLVCTVEARMRITELATAEKNNPTSQIVDFEPSEYSERDDLADEGVPVDEAANRRIQELQHPVKLFAEKYQHDPPSIEEILAVFPTLSELRIALRRADADGVHLKQKDYAWGTLSEACAHAAKCANLTFDMDPGAFLLSVLLEASQYPEPKFDPEQNAQFNESQQWGKPAARIDAAEGLIELACFPSGATSEVLKVVEVLISDPVPSVRFQVVIRLLCLSQTANTFMWKLIDRIATEEVNRGVLLGFVNAVLSQLAGKHPDKVTVLVQQIFIRTAPGIPLRKACVRIYRSLFLREGHTGAGEMIQTIVTNPLAHSDECIHFVAGLRETLKGFGEPAESNQVLVRMRTWSILLQVLQVAKEQWRPLAALAQEKGGWSMELQQQARGLYQIFDSASMEVYLASGAFDNKRSLENSEEISLNPNSKRLFFTEASEVLDALVDISLANVTHNLLKTLDYLVPVDPVGMFLRIGRAVLSGQDGGYQYESMAADLVVKIVERYLAEYQGIFRDNSDCLRTLLELLDLFVQAGWPSARKLTYRLDEIFR
ncbi:hypothetical protein [Paenibacillus chitinolyticus]|uniref:hypothetical protein n=1 Tax=Paenibacillus chitinolyticus TaxID=79263 RepID=UPI00362A03E3